MNPDQELEEHQQLNLFPLHPENLFEERDVQDDNVSYLFNADGGVSLNGLLGVTGRVVLPPSEEEEEEEEEEGEEEEMGEEREDSLSPSLTTYTNTLGGGGGGQDSDEVGSSLAKTALRQREREASEEKWVIYSEVVENSNNEAAMSISSSSCCNEYCNNNNSSWYHHHQQQQQQQQEGHQGHHQGNQGLWLKLDYEEILNAWSDKAPLYIEGESPQTVPDVLDDSLSNGFVDGGGLGSNAGVQRVPDVGSSMVGEDQAGIEGTKKGQRQARVLRYKQKRQSRLFSKRIRYEVRKLNAEKRPRMKGRFVKRN
ncbi:zinc finger protein CONSTANS-LIKE 6-like [Macadamia integrifolia]|uniref:zinc finger protein CONSTANS-LIKE 6-like n=1 Tax=Macadamia integrifolia TaxID=60698 RepID=UPI001C4FEE33|nr:zinc finger protein CONSTANS-LIKE 6-like [Macadamia integrifolia]